MRKRRVRDIDSGRKIDQGSVDRRHILKDREREVIEEEYGIRGVTCTEKSQRRCKEKRVLENEKRGSGNRIRYLEYMRRNKDVVYTEETTSTRNTDGWQKL